MGTIATTSSLAIFMPGVTFDAATTTLASFCISWAENHVKSSLARRYDVSGLPFTVATTTSMLTSLVEEFAMGYFHKQNSRGSTQSITRGEALLKTAQDKLNDLANGRLDLLDATNGSSVVSERSTNEVIYSSTSAYHTTFDEGDPLGWGPDEDKISDIETERA